MRRFLTLLLTMLITLSFAGCATPTKEPIKCPACGYQFDKPTN